MSENFLNHDKRIVSFFIWDPELEKRIDFEVKMIDGISKLLNVATTIEQTIECNKALVLSQQRMLAFMAEIRRKQENLLKHDETNLEATKATVILSDIRLPLNWTKMKKAKSEQKKFAVFCLAKIGYEIIDTKLIHIDKTSREILFADKLVFENVPQNFQLHLEIYALNQSLAVSSAGKDFANRYSYFQTHGSPSLGRKKIDVDAKTSNQVQESKFTLIARATYTKQSASKYVKTRSLQIERQSENPLMQLPIESPFLSRLAIDPLCYTRPSVFAGIVELDRVPYSCILGRGYLKGEEITRYDYSDQRTFSIQISSDTVILARDDHLSFSIYNRGFDQQEFFVQDRFTLNMWIKALQQHIVDMRAWESTFEHVSSLRRYSHQPLVVSASSSDLTDRSAVKRKAQSLDNLHQVGITAQPIHRSTIEVDTSSRSYDDDDDDNESVLHTRL